ncbi:MAG: TPM domain-containing protein [Isosphaeraceae bacterium]|nr:TPM domain-containing protein [Isosphaeraceae bacterium]
MKRVCPIGVVLLALSGAMPCMAQSRDPGVRDVAKMFSAPAVQKADERLKDLHRDGGWDVFIETIDSLKDQTIEQRARSDAQVLNAHGLVVVISKADHKLDVQPSRSAEKVFTKDKVSQIVRLMTESFKSKEYDKGLLDAVAAIEDDARVVGVRDSAKMFSADAVKKANESLAALRRKSRWQVVVETVDSLKGQTPAERAIANGKAMNVHGLSIVISKGDHRLTVEPSDSARKTFTKAKTEAIAETIERDFKAKEYDKGLLDAVAAIESDVASNVVATSTPALPASAAPPAPPLKPVAAAKPVEPPSAIPPTVIAQPVPAADGNGTSKLPMIVIAVVGVLFLFWIVSMARRRREPVPPPQGWQQPPQPQPGYAPQGPRPGPPGYLPPGPPAPGYAPGPGYGPAPGYGPPPPQHGGGLGGFAAGALGGLGGAIAGNILYDQFGRPHQGGAPVVPPHEHSAGGVFPPAQPTPGQEPPRETFDPNAGATGDWGADNNQAAPPPDQWGGDAGASGDWGAGQPAADAGASGDWGSGEPAAEEPGPTGDWGGGSEEPDASGDWGGDAGAPDAPDQDQGGSW